MVLRPWRALQIEREHVQAVERRLTRELASQVAVSEEWVRERRKLLDRLKAANEEAVIAHRKNDALEGKLQSKELDLSRFEEAIAEDQRIQENEMRALRERLHRHDTSWAKDKDTIEILRSNIRGMETSLAQRRDIIDAGDKRMLTMMGTIRKLQSSGAKARSAARKALERVTYLEGELAKVRPPCTKPPLTHCQYDPDDNNRIGPVSARRAARKRSNES